jgi:hypothetical protein
MPILVPCPNCSAKLNAPDAAAGKRVKCPKCTRVINVPAAVVEYEVVDDDPPPTPARRKPQLAGEGETPRPPASAQRSAAPVEVNEAVDDGEADTPGTRPARGSGDEGKSPKKQGKTAKSPLPLLLGVGGGLVVLLAVVGIVVGVMSGGGGAQARTTPPAPPPPPGVPSAPGDTSAAPPTSPVSPPTSPSLPPPSPAVDTRLREAARFDAVPIPTAPLDPLVYAEEVDPYEDDRPRAGTGLLRQELYRQGVLLAAREELGLTTRDATLGEVPPDGLPAAQRVRVVVRLPNGAAPREVRVETGPADKSRAVWAVESPAPLREDILAALWSADELTRGGFVTALRRAGGWAVAPRKQSDQPLPASAVTALDRPSVVSQLSAVREMHAAVREAGESPAALAALSRGYANLGVLTDSQWDGSTWAFKARSLLYAERLRRLHPAAPLGWWARGYALALTGRHADALRDFAEADRVKGKEVAPGWVPLAVGLCRFDTRGLGDLADGPLADTALLFQYLTAEGWSSSARGRELGVEFLKRHPLCHRVADPVARDGELGPRRRHSLSGLAALTDGFRGELERANGLPRAVSSLVQDEGRLDDLLDALDAAGREPKDRRELSWAVLARAAREARFTLVEARLAFLRYALAVPADDFLEEVRPWVEGHPLAPVLAAYSTDLNRRPEALRKELRKPPVGWYTARQENRRLHARFLTPADAAAMRELSDCHGDVVCGDLSLTLKHVKGAAVKPYALQLMAVSPHSPLARASLISCDWESVRDLAGVWEKECQHPVVTKLLAQRATADKRADDAERLLLKTLEFGKDLDTSTMLADLYLARGDEDRWRATLEEAIGGRAEGLEHAGVQVKLAMHYAGKKEFATARRYAEPAAETWAAWAMLCASVCAEGDGDYKTAELWVRRTSERYAEDSRQAWYYWCLRTGRGDLGKARAVVEDHLKAVGTPKTERDKMLRVMLLLIDDKPKEAAPILEQVFEVEQDGFYLLLAAAAWDRAGDTAKRDKLLKVLPPQSGYHPVAELLREAAAKGGKAVPDEKRVDEVIRGLVPGLRPNASLFAAEFFRRRGQRAASDRYYKAAQEIIPPLAIGPPLAGVALRDE